MGSGGVAIAALPTVICLKVSFSDGLGGVIKRFILRRFGAIISNEANIYSSAKIYYPRNLVMEGLSNIGPDATIYNVDVITIKDCATIPLITRVNSDT